MKLYRFTGIDGNIKVFPEFRCFMPSKQFRDFDWVCRVDFPKLVEEQYNSYKQSRVSPHFGNLKHDGNKRPQW